MAYQTGGSFAGGFMTAFLAAQRLGMQKRHYKTMDAYYNWRMNGGAGNPNNTPAKAMQDSRAKPLDPSYGGRANPSAAAGAKSGYAVPANNNPGNLEDNKWTQSLPGYKGTDGRFAIFDTPENGTSAAEKNIGSKAGQATTLRQLANIWAPKGDGANDPDAYATRLAKGMGTTPDAKINFADPQVQQQLVPLIANVEHGGQAGFSTAPVQLSSAAPAQPGTSAPPVAQAIPTPPPRPVDLGTDTAPVTSQGNNPAVTATPQQIVTPAPPPQTPPQTATPPVAVPADQAGDISLAAKKGGPVTRQSYSKGGIVKAFDLGGATDDEGEDSEFEGQDQQEQFMLNQSEGTPGASDGTPLLEPPPASAIPTQAQDANTSGDTQVASSSPYGMGSLPRIGAGLGGSGMRMGGGGRMPGGGGSGRPDTSTASYYAGMNNDPAMEPPPDTPRIADAQGNLAQSAAAAITAGMRSIAGALGANVAIPSDPDQANAHRSFANGDGSISREELAAAHQAVDPNGSLRGNMRDIAAMEGGYTWYVQHGMQKEAGEMAGAILQRSRDTAAEFGEDAAKEIYKGNPDGAMNAIMKAYDATPDGSTGHFTKNADGTYTVQQKNMNQKVTWAGTVGPTEIMSAALGFKDGTLTWKLLGEAAAKYDPQGQAEAHQVSPGTQAEIAKLYGGVNQQGAGQAPPQQGIPAGTPAAATGPAPAPAPQTAQVTPQGNTPQPQAIPTAGQPQVSSTPPNPFAGRPVPSEIASGQTIPTNPNAPAPGATEAGFNIPGELPQSVLDAHKKNLDDQLSQLQQQILGPAMAMRPPVNVQHLNSLPEGSADRKAYISAIQDVTKQWQQEVMAPAQARYNSEVSSLRDQNRSDLTEARQALGGQRAAAAADVRAQRAAEMADTRQKANADLQETRDTDLANRGFQREVVNRQISPGSDLEKLRDSTDTTTLPTAFGGSAYTTQFNPDEREGIRNAAVEIGRLNNLPADTASHIAAKIILDPADDPKDAAYKATPIKNFAGGASGTFVKLTPQKPSANLPEIVMPASHYMNLLTTRNQLVQRVDMAKTTAGENQLRDEGRATRAAAFQDRLEKKLAIPQGVTPQGNYVPVIDRPTGIPMSNASPGVVPGVPETQSPKYVQPRLVPRQPTGADIYRQNPPPLPSGYGVPFTPGTRYAIPPE